MIFTFFHSIIHFYWNYWINLLYLTNTTYKSWGKFIPIRIPISITIRKILRPHIIRGPTQRLWGAWVVIAITESSDRQTICIEDIELIPCRKKPVIIPTVYHILAIVNSIIPIFFQNINSSIANRCDSISTSAWCGHIIYSRKRSCIDSFVGTFCSWCGRNTWWNYWWTWWQCSKIWFISM